MAKSFYIIGASGAGKDSLLNYLRHRCYRQVNNSYLHIVTSHAQPMPVVKTILHYRIMSLHNASKLLFSDALVKPSESLWHWD